MSLSIATVLPLILGGMCLTVALLHLSIGFVRALKQTTRLRALPVSVHISFALSAFGVAIATILQAWLYETSSLEDVRQAFKWMLGFEIVFWFSVIWFIVFFTDLKNRWLPILITILLAIATLIHISSPGGILMTEVNGIAKIAGPLGLAEISLPTGPANPFRVVSDLALVLFFFLGFLSCRNLFLIGSEQRRNAIFLSVSLSLLLIGTGLSSLVDLGLIELPYLFTYTYVGVILIMSFQIISEVVQVSTLRNTVSVQEDRWKSFCNNVQLIIVSLDSTGNITFVNPYFEQLTGCAANEVIGQDWFERFPIGSDKKELTAVFESGEVPDHYQNTIQTCKGEKLEIAFSNVVLKDLNSGFLGTISVGTNVTEKEKAEAQVRKTLAELESLRDQLKEDNILLLEEVSKPGQFTEIIGESSALMYVFHRIEEVAPSDTAVLLEGETGVGKELIAQAVHKNSSRSNQPFIKVDCATIPPTLIESELFGHERGAFSGAFKNRKGRFELADGGTIFLDEIGELPLEMQPKLLRILQEGTFERLGSEKTTRVDVRLIAATNRDLKKEVEEGRFRGDLYFRLSVFPISVPPLRKRIEDIPLLTDKFVESFSKKHGKRITKISNYIREKLQSYDWPGNVRELQNVLERAVITTPGKSLKLQSSLESHTRNDQSSSRPGKTLVEIEKQHITDTLQHCSWKISGEDGAASLLGLHPNTLRSKMQKLGIKRATSSDPEMNKLEV